MKVFSKFQQKLPAEFEDASLLTIAAGAVTVSQQFHRIDTESNTASDDLTTINGPTTFKTLYIRPNNSTRTVVVKHNAGNIKCFGDADITLDDNHDCVILVWDEVGSVWCALAAGGGGSGVLLTNATVAGTGIQELLGLNLTDPTELTISSGVITLTQGAHTVDTEANAASDDLVTINAAKGVGDVVVLVPENDARTIVLKHGTGNIHTFNGSDISLDTDDHWALLFRIGARWVVLANGAASLPVTDSTALVADGTKYAGLDAGPVTAGQTRRIQTPDGNSRVRDVITWMFAGTAITGATYTGVVVPAGFFVESIRISADVSGAGASPSFQPLYNNSTLGGAITLGGPAYGYADIAHAAVTVNSTLAVGGLLQVNCVESGTSSGGSACTECIMYITGYYTHE